MDQIKQKKLLKYIDDCHKAAMGAIEIIADTGINEMINKGITIDLNNLQPIEIAKHAAQKLNLDEEAIADEYIDLMVLEKMIEIIREVEVEK